MVNGSYGDSEHTLFPDRSILDYSSIRDIREIASMPELQRSTLMDQIDYDLDNYKINESSMSYGSVDQSKMCIPKQQFMRAQESKGTHKFYHSWIIDVKMISQSLFLIHNFGL